MTLFYLEWPTHLRIQGYMTDPTDLEIQETFIYLKWPSDQRIQGYMADLLINLIFQTWSTELIRPTAALPDLPT